ncbi:MAG: TonB-dependent receptor [Calditrichaeota bacterium]|nr:TonB-dependent receptor [Calditrichota bacterium]
MKKIFLNIAFIFIFAAVVNLQGQVSTHGSLEGDVLDVKTKEPLIGANIVILGTNIGTMSDLQGHFFLKKVPVGNYSIKATIIGYKSKTVTVQVKYQQTTKIKFELPETVLEMPELIVTAGKKAQSFQDVPNSVSLVTTREIERRNRTYLNEVLEYTPGVNFMHGDVNIRGSSGFSLGAGSRVLLLLDGIPMMPGDSGDIKWDIIPISQIERVEVVKGAGSALYGSYAIGGVINIISKEPSSEPYTELKFSTGIYDKPYYPEWKWTDKTQHFSQTDVTHSRKWKNIGILLSAGRRTSTGYQQNGDYINWNLLGRMDIHFDTQSQLTLQTNFSTGDHGEIFQWRNQNDVFEMPVTSVGDWTSSSKFSTNGVFRQLVNPRFTYKIRVSYFENYWKHHYHDNDDYSQAQNIGFETQADYVLTSSQSLTFGIETVHDITNSAMFGDHTGTNWAGYLQDEIHFGTLVTATAGIRYDYHTVDTGIHDSQINPKLGFTVKPSPFSTFRASVGRGFRSPTMAEMFTETTTSGFRIIPNPDLQAEKAWSYEIGINQILSENLLLDLALFHNDYENFIEPDRDEQNTVFFINADRARIRGLEFMAQSNWLKKKIHVKTSYTLLDPKYVSRDYTLFWWAEKLAGKKDPQVSFSAPLAYRAKHLFTNSVDFDLGKFDFGIDFRYVSKLDSVKVYPTDKRVPQKVWDARVSYKMDRVTLSFNINNLFNYSYTQIERNMAPVRHYVFSVNGRF